MLLISIRHQIYKLCFLLSGLYFFVLLTWCKPDIRCYYYKDDKFRRRVQIVATDSTIEAKNKGQQIRFDAALHSTASARKFIISVPTIYIILIMTRTLQCIIHINIKNVKIVEMYRIAFYNIKVTLKYPRE